MITSPFSVIQKIVIAFFSEILIISADHIVVSKLQFEVVSPEADDEMRKMRESE